MPITFKKIPTLIGVASGTIALIFFLDQVYQEWHLVQRIGQALDTGGRFGIVLPTVCFGPVCLGHIVIAIIAIFLILLVFYRRATHLETEQKKRREEEEQLRSEFGVKERYTDVAVVNEDLSEAWDYLRETNCGPTLQAFLETVEPTYANPRTTLWAGTAKIGGREYYLQGKSDLSRPTKLEVECLSGALRGYSSVFKLRKTKGGTEVKMEARLNLRSVPREDLFSAVPKLSDLLRKGKLRSLWERQREAGSEARSSPSRAGS